LDYHGDIAIDVNSLTANIGDRAVYTLLTRCTGNVFLVLPGGSDSSLRGGLRSPLLMSILNFMSMLRTSVLSLDLLRANHMHPLHPRRFAASFQLMNLPPQLLLGSSLGPFVGQVALGSVRDNARELLGLHSFFLTDSAVPHRTSVPRARPPLLSRAVDRLVSFYFTERPSKEFREVLDRFGGYTNQIFDSFDDRAIPLRHSRNDPSTMNISLDKRIHPREHKLSRARFARIGPDAQILVDSYIRGTHIDTAVPFDHDLFEHCFALCEEQWLKERTRAELVRIAAANPPEWDPTFTRLFLKGQVVRKLAALNARAKPGQIVTTFPLWSIFYEAPYAMYLEIILNRLLPANFYLHSGKTPAEFSDWYAKHWVTGEATGTDYTSWDTGCDEAFLGFDRWLMGIASLPSSFVAHYVNRKLSLNSFAGPMPVMQCSGDRWTWLLNTHRNIAFSNNKFAIPFGTPQCYSGDDMLLAGYVHVRRNFQPDRWKLKVKLERGPLLSFCGFLLGRASLSIDTHQLYARTRIAAASGAPLSTWENYAQLAFPFDDLDVIDEEHQAAVNLIAAGLEQPSRPSEAYASRREQNPIRPTHRARTFGLGF